MQSFVLQENVLTDNLLIVPNKGKVFKGNYIALIKEYCFQNAWSDKETVKKFRNKDRLFAYIDKVYPEFSYMLDFTGTAVE